MFLNVFNSLLEQHGLNKRQFSIKSGIPYTTIDGFYKKGHENIRLGTLKKIASFFEVSLDFLVFGDERIRSGDKPFNVTRNEQVLVTAYRNHPDVQPVINKILDIKTEDPSISSDIIREFKQDVPIPTNSN